MAKLYLVLLFVFAIGAGAYPAPDDGDGDAEDTTPVEVTTSTSTSTSTPTTTTGASSSSSQPPITTSTNTATQAPTTTTTQAPTTTTEGTTATSAPETTETEATTIVTISIPTSTEARQPKAENATVPTTPAAEKVDLLKYRWDADKSKYIRLGTTTECPTNMRFFASADNETAGQCDCDYYQCSRPLLYSPKSKECHFAWSRGPCEESEWYAFNKDLQPVCEPRKCQEGLSEEPVTSQTVTLSYWFVDPNGDGACREAGSDETCTEEDETLLLAPGEPIPKCRATAVCVPLARPEPQLCFKGNRRFAEGKCP